MSEIRDLAYQDYLAGMKYQDIADKYSVSLSAVKSWATRYWKKGCDKDKKVATKKEKKLQPKVATIEEEKTVVADEVKSVVENPNLTEKQRLFCIYYVKYRNKVKAYQKSFQCSYENACGNASSLWKNIEIQKEVNRLLNDYRENIDLDIKDLFQWYLNIARADINDFVKVKDFGISVREQIDGTLVSEISETQAGIKVKLNDRMKAMEWLSQHIDLADEKMRAEIALLREKSKGNEKDKLPDNMQTLADIVMNSRPNRNLEDYE